MTGYKFPELEQLERIIEQFGDHARTQVIERIRYKDHEFPIHCITLGSPKPDVPVLAFFGGVHGLEKIGSEAEVSPRIIPPPIFQNSRLIMLALTLNSYPAVHTTHNGIRFCREK